MSFVTTQPEMLSTAAGDLASIGSATSALNAAAAAPTTEVVPVAAVEVSAVRAAQLVSAQAAAIHDQFVAMLGLSAGTYAATEAANPATTGPGGV